MKEFLLLLGLLAGTCQFNLEILEPDLVEPMVLINGKLTDYYNSSVYDQNFVCTNGQLEIIEFQQAPGQQLIVFRYSGVELTRDDIQIVVGPNIEPRPVVKNFSKSSKKFTLEAGCPAVITKENYFNKVKIRMVVREEEPYRRINAKYQRKTIQKMYEFDFLLNCDLWDVHKHFEYGYIFISIICITVVVFVSLHPRICSLIINGTHLNLQIRWRWFLAGMTLLMSGLGFIYYKKVTPQTDISVYFGNRSEYEYKFQLANQFLRHIGLLCSLVSVFVCCSELFFQWPFLLQFLPFPHIKFGKYAVSRRAISSVFLAILSYIIGLQTQNWIYYNLLSFCIAVAAIKMFRFRSLRNGFYTMAIVVTSIGLFTLWSFFKLPRSLNDYASQLSSPLFVQVPDLVNNLYKKCSWISIYDMVLPGSILAYLRDYDQNYHVGWKGVYTFTSIVTFSCSCVVWVIIQALSEYNISFCIVTYPPFIISVMLLSLYRNQFETLWYGYFHFTMDFNTMQLLQTYRNSKDATLAHTFPRELLDVIKYDESRWSDSESVGLGGNRRPLNESEMEIWSATLGRRASPGKEGKDEEEKNMFASQDVSLRPREVLMDRQQGERQLSSSHTFTNNVKQS